MTPFPYAKVIVDLSSDQLDRLFIYSIPAGMAISPGHRVYVPFGARVIEGYVTELAGCTDLSADIIKEIIRPAEDYPAILPELIDLAGWIARKYHCRLADALRLMIPAQLRGGRVKEKTAQYARLLLDDVSLERLIQSNARAPKRLKLIELLGGGSLTLAEINAALPGASTAIKALREQGALEVNSRTVMRSPYSSINSADESDDAGPELMPQQAEAVGFLLDAAQSPTGGRFLIQGVTGSGKTEVYIRLIHETLSQGKGAIVLVPEISLTPQMVDWFRRRFRHDAAVLHSRLSPGEKYDEWRRIRFGEARVVIGARSAVFAPVERLGVIIVDEEHENSYQSEKRPRYDAREVAWQRAASVSGVLVLGSATPSISTYMKAMPGVKRENRLTLIEMPDRVMSRPMPEVSIVDMRQELIRGNKSIFSGALAAALKQCLARGQQAMLFINRRGYSTFVSCRACGHVERCAQCDVSMTYHIADGLMRCHYCGEERQTPNLCPRCGSRFIKYFGTGTQKVESEARALLPNAKIARMDMDTTSSGKDAHERILSAFRRGEHNVLVGTQMITKGLDFPNVTLVGVIAADLSLNLPDYRSAERTFQLITQVAGRAGRAEAIGRVIVQTYEPDHFCIQMVARQDYRAFYMREVQNRRRGLNPPFTAIARLMVTADDDSAAEAAAKELEDRLNAFLDEGGRREDVVQMRALEAPLKRIRGEARWQVFIKMYSNGAVDETLDFMEQLESRVHGGARVDLEVNPVNLL